MTRRVLFKHEQLVIWQDSPSSIVIRVEGIGYCELPADQMEKLGVALIRNSPEPVGIT